MNIEVLRLARVPSSKIPRDRSGRPLMFAMWSAKPGPYVFMVSEHLAGFRASYSHETDRRPVFIDGGPFLTLAQAEAACALAWRSLQQ